MGIFDRFKKKDEKEPAKKAAPAAIAQKNEVKKEPAEAPIEAKAVPAKKEKTIREELATDKKSGKKQTKTTGLYAYRVLIRPIVSEKSAHLHAMNQYVFLVAPSANKFMVKQAIKDAYNATPEKVSIIKMQGKRVRRGIIEGREKDYKKAVVIMPKGVTLPVYEGV